MSDIRETFPFSYDWLWYYLQVEKLTGKEIYAKLKVIDSWLAETCYENVIDRCSPAPDGKFTSIRKNHYAWSLERVRIPSDYNPFITHSLSASIFGNTYEVVPKHIRFKNNEDLLAFKLKFGITCPDML